MAKRASSSVDPLGESLALTTYANTKNLILGALDLRGPLDTEAMREAIASVGDAFPVLRMCLKEVRKRGKHYLVWDHRPGLEIPFIIRGAGKTEPSASSLDILLNCLQTSLDKERNLFLEPPCEVHLVKVAQDHHMLAAVISHVAGDAITFAEIAKEAMIKYHEIVTGDKAALSCYPGASAVRKRVIRKRKTTWRDYWRTFRYALIPYGVKCAIPAGSGFPDDRREHHVKQLLSQEDSERIVAESLKSRVSAVDYLVATVTAAIYQWNKARGIGAGTVTAALTVNMQGRFEDMESPNNDSVLYFRLSAEQKKETETLARLILFARISQFRRQMDRKYSRAIAKLNNLFRVFPFKARQKIFVQILQRHQTSFALGFLGILWPEADDRKITADSCLTSAGGISINEVHGIAYKLVSRTPLYLSAYFFLNRLNLILSAAAWQFTREEAQAFLDLVVDLLRPKEV
ncbi:MAG: condensation domain-containing protein [Desulfomonilaceae bacterium]